MKTKLSTPNNSHKHWRLPALVLAVLAVSGSGWFFYTKNTTAQASTNLKSDSKPVFELANTDVTTVHNGELALKLPISGSLIPVSQAAIKSKVTAEVRETLVQEGMNVKKGQVIARFDAADLHARLLTQQAAVDQARAKLELAEKNRSNSEELLKQKYISQNAFDVSHNSLELARADLKSALSLQEVAQIAVSDTQIKAPIDGIVSKRYVQTGDKVSPDAPLFSIVNLTQLTLEAQVPASEITRVKIGQSASFKIDGYIGHDFSGKVVRINPVAEAGSRAVLVYIVVDNPEGLLKGGMFAKGSLILEKAASMPLLPVTAVRHVDNSDFVYKVVGDKIQVQPVKLGLRNEDEGIVQVIEGLESGENVLAVKLDEVKAGSAVRLPKAAVMGKG